MSTARTATKARQRPNGPPPASHPTQERERPAAQPQTPPPQPKQEVVTFAAFKAEMDERANEFMALLPPHIDKTRFLSACIVAIKQRPELLAVDRRSLHIACNQAAEDGLLPNGIEGVINIYKEKVKSKRGNTWVEEWVPRAKWVPMVQGIRKRAREVCGIMIDAEVVHAKDHFVWRKGDNPSIEHNPPPLGTDRGEMIGCYAIFREPVNGTGWRILHREVMTAGQVAAVRSTSKQPDGMLWTKFTDRAWLKTAVRRGIKSVPAVHPQFGVVERIAGRDDDQYQFDSLPANGSAGSAPLMPPMNGAGAQPLMPPGMEDGGADGPVDQTPPSEQPQAPPEESYLDKLGRLFAEAGTTRELEQVWEMEEREINELPRDQQRAAAARYAEHEKRLAAQKKGAK